MRVEFFSTLSYREIMVRGMYIIARINRKKQHFEHIDFLIFETNKKKIYNFFPLKTIEL